MVYAQRSAVFGKNGVDTFKVFVANAVCASPRGLVWLASVALLLFIAGGEVELHLWLPRPKMRRSHLPNEGANRCFQFPPPKQCVLALELASSYAHLGRLGEGGLARRKARGPAQNGLRSWPDHLSPPDSQGAMLSKISNAHALEITLDTPRAQYIS